MTTPVPEPIPDFNSPQAKEASRFLTDIVYDTNLSAQVDKCLAIPLSPSGASDARFAALDALLAKHSYKCTSADYIAGYAHWQNTSFLPWTGQYILYDTSNPAKEALAITLQGSRSGEVVLYINGHLIYDVVDTSADFPRSLFFNGARNGANGFLQFGISTPENPVLELGSRFAAFRMFKIGDKVPQKPTHVGVELAHDFTQFHGSYTTSTTTTDGDMSSGPSLRVQVKEHPQVGKPILVDVIIENIGNDSNNPEFLFLLRDIPVSRNTLSWDASNLAINLQDPKIAALPIAQYANGYLDFYSTLVSVAGDITDAPIFEVGIHLSGSVWGVKDSPTQGIQINGDFVPPTLVTDAEVLAASGASTNNGTVNLLTATPKSDVATAQQQPQSEHGNTGIFASLDHSGHRISSSGHHATASSPAGAGGFGGIVTLPVDPPAPGGGTGGTGGTGTDIVPSPGSWSFLDKFSPSATFLGDLVSQFGSFFSGRTYGSVGGAAKAEARVGSFTLYRSVTTPGGGSSTVIGEFMAPSVEVGGATNITGGLNAQGGPGGSASGVVMAQSGESFFKGMGGFSRAALAIGVVVGGSVFLYMSYKVMSKGQFLARMSACVKMPFRAILGSKSITAGGKKTITTGDPRISEFTADPHLTPEVVTTVSERPALLGPGDMPSKKDIDIAKSRQSTGLGALEETSSKGLVVMSQDFQPQELGMFTWEVALDPKGRVFLNPISDGSSTKLYRNPSFKEGLFAIRFLDAIKEETMVAEVRNPTDGQKITQKTKGFAFDPKTGFSTFDKMNVNFIPIEDGFFAVLVTSGREPFIIPEQFREEFFLK